jgi:two-component system, LuxR family, response regulator TtrR
MNDRQQVICIVDDDDAVVRALRRLLMACGYVVRAFTSAQDFLDQPVSDDANVCCLIVDVHMPGTSGLELQSALQAAERPLPIVFVTGAGDAKLRCRALGDGAVAFLQKPFADVELIQAVELAAAQVEARRAQAVEVLANKRTS